MGYSTWGHRELDMPEWLTHTQTCLVATVADRTYLSVLVSILPRYCMTHSLKYTEIIFIHLFMWALDITLKYRRPRKFNLPAMLETWVPFLGWEDPLEKWMATHSSNLDWRIPRTKEPGRLQPMGSQAIVHRVAETDVTEWLKLSFSLTSRVHRH